MCIHYVCEIHATRVYSVASTDLVFPKCQTSTRSWEKYGMNIGTVNLDNCHLTIRWGIFQACHFQFRSASTAVQIGFDRVTVNGFDPRMNTPVFYLGLVSELFHSSHNGGLSQMGDMMLAWRVGREAWQKPNRCDMCLVDWLTSMELQEQRFSNAITYWI